MPNYSVSRGGASIRVRRAAAVLVPALSLSSCLPSLPTVPTLDNPSDPTPRFSEPVVWVSAPAENGVVQRSDLFSSRGVPIMFDGSFTPGHELHLLAGRVESPNIGFFITIIAVTDTVSPGPAFIRSSPTVIGNSDRIRLKLRLRDDQNLVISIDSVTLRLR